MERVGVLVIGGGPAGLAVSHELAAVGPEHLVLERGLVGQSWRDRWDSFCLVIPNWTCRLPGGEYDGPDPDGFLPRDGVVAHLERYAAASRAPLREGVEVTWLGPGSRGGFLARTSAGDISADQVVVATGTYRRPFLPAGADTLPAGLTRLVLDDYRRPEDLPPGPVLVVGSGQSGCQIADDLVRSGREVVLSCGKAPWLPRRINGWDVARWAVLSGFMDRTASSLPSPAARLGANVLATGRDGGRDLNLRTLRAIGVRLVGRFLGADGATARFAPDLATSVAFGDDRYRDLRALFRRTAEAHGLPEPDLPDPEPWDDPGATEIPLDGFGAAIFSGGFRPDYASWMAWPEAFDTFGFPIQVDGASTVVPGLSFVGTHFLRTRKSATLLGMGEDATIVARGIAGRVA